MSEESALGNGTLCTCEWEAAGHASSLRHSMDEMALVHTYSAHYITLSITQSAEPPLHTQTHTSCTRLSVLTRSLILQASQARKSDNPAPL